MVLIATAAAVDANSYASVARAEIILGQRLYATDWDNAAETPDAAGYLANGGATPGSTSIAVDSGSGTFTAGSKVQFAGHETIYTVSTALAAAGNLVLTSGLTQAVEDDEIVTRITASTREKSLIWATSLLDAMMIWKGTIRTEDQALRWPRSGVYKPDGYTYDYDTIPSLLEVGTSELALYLLGTNSFEVPGLLGQGIAEAKLGPLSVKVDKSERQDVIPENILSILSPLGELEPEADFGTKIIPLKRV